MQSLETSSGGSAGGVVREAVSTACCQGGNSAERGNLTYQDCGAVDRAQAHGAHANRIAEVQGRLITSLRTKAHLQLPVHKSVRSIACFPGHTVKIQL